MATIQDAIAELQMVIGNVTGIRFAPDSAPDQIANFPAAICRSHTADWKLNDASFFTALHTIVIELHMTRAPGLPRAIATVNPLGDRVVKAILAVFASGGFKTFQATGHIMGEFGPMKWDETETIGWRIYIENVKIQSAVT